MREYKFRAWDWDGENGYAMSYSKDWSCLFNDGFKCKYSDGTVMQYTGLKDKNEVEIYEGDLLKDGSRLWKIEISPIYGIFFILTKGKHSRCYSDFPSYLVDEFQVIGNIYENPELLN